MQEGASAKKKQLVLSYIDSAKRSMAFAVRSSDKIPGMSIRASFDAVYSITKALFALEDLESAHTDRTALLYLADAFERSGTTFPDELSEIFVRLSRDSRDALHNQNREILMAESRRAIGDAETFYSAVMQVINERTERMKETEDNKENRTAMA